MREVDDLHDTEDQRQADGDQGIEQAERDAVQHELKEVDRIDGHYPRRIAITGPVAFAIGTGTYNKMLDTPLAQGLC